MHICLYGMAHVQKASEGMLLEAALCTFRATGGLWDMRVEDTRGSVGVLYPDGEGERNRWKER